MTSVIMRPRFLQFPRPGQQLRLLRPFLRGQRLRVWRPSWIGQRLSFGDPPGTGNGSGSRGPFDPILKPECPVSASSSRCVSLSTKGYSEFGPGSGSGYGDPPGSVRGVRSGDPSGTRSGHGSCGPSDPSSGFSRIPSNSDTTWMETAHKPDYNALERWRSRTKASCVMMGPPAGISIRPQYCISERVTPQALLREFEGWIVRGVFSRQQKDTPIRQAFL